MVDLAYALIRGLAHFWLGLTRRRRLGLTRLFGSRFCFGVLFFACLALLLLLRFKLCLARRFLLLRFGFLFGVVDDLKLLQGLGYGVLLVVYLLQSRDVVLFVLFHLRELLFLGGLLGVKIGFFLVIARHARLDRFDLFVLLVDKILIIFVVFDQPLQLVVHNDAEPL